MKRIAGLVIRLDPSAWRARYGAEMQALVEDATPGTGVVLDLLKGAIGMQLSVWNFPRLALVLGVVGILAGLLSSYLVTPRYTSRAVVRFSEAFLPAEQETLSRTSLSSIIQDPRLDLYPSERERVPLEDVIERMRRRDIQIAPVALPMPGLTSQSAFEISFTYPDPVKARQVVQVFITRFMESDLTRTRKSRDASRDQAEISQLKARIAALEQRAGIPAEVSKSFFESRASVESNVEILDPPSFPQLPVFPNRSAFMAAGFGAGIAIAFLIAVARFTRTKASPPPLLAID
jgi:hypothetical protein